MLRFLIAVGVALSAPAALAQGQVSPTTTPANPAYLVVEINVKDKEGFKEYAEKATQTVLQHGGRFVTFGENIQTIEGPNPNGTFVIIQFKSLDDAKGWLSSPEYAAVKGIRHRTADARQYLVEGLPATPTQTQATATPQGSPSSPPKQTQANSARLTPELEQLKTSLSKYSDPLVAIRDGYLSTLACIDYPGGGMGVHFVNRDLIGPAPDPQKPPILVYEPDGGQLRLVAAEWFIPLATGIKERPSLFGQPFDGPMAGHEPVMPKELHHYDLHVWLFKPNPAGLFSPTNPDVSCAGKTGYARMEEPPTPVPHEHK